MIGKLSLGNDHQTAGRHVEAMNDEWTRRLRELLTCPRIDGWLLRILSRHGEHTFRLVDDG